MPASVTALFVAVAGILALMVGFRARLTRSREGKILAFVALLVLPALAMWAGFSAQMERAQSTSFCLSCHVMTDFGRSLQIDDPSYLPARHFQNRLLPADRACYTCHTNYTMFGGVRDKLRGLRHLWVQYAGVVPPSDQIKLYQPYSNRECLHCHLGARRFEEASAHHRAPDLLSRAKSGHLSCLSSGCHDIIHDVGTLKDAAFWKGAR